MALHQDNSAAITAASPAAVIKTLAATGRYCRQGRWLGKGNRYASDTVQKLANDIASNTINRRHLAQYIAVSTVLHASDGWSYLGRAIQSLLQGDPHRALHLSYYAELRAAMSLLATQGIGVFKNKHFIVDASNQATSLPKNSQTHEFAWDALNFWAQSSSSGSVFAAILRPYGRSLEDWLSPVGGGAAVLPQAQEWLKQWGMDLSLIGEDRESRNARSYRPSGLPAPWSVNPELVVKFASNIWGVLEPGVSTFEKLDRHVLRLSVESLFRGRTGSPPSRHNNNFITLVNSVVDNQGMSGRLATEWAEFLFRMTDPDDPDLMKYSKVPPQDGEADPYGVISRSTLLLRIATGATHQLFENAGVASQSIDFWRSDLGRSRGFWDANSRPEAMSDLWSDVVDAVTELAPFYDEIPAADRTLRNLAVQFGAYIVPFGGFERVALWGVLSSQ
ncbi:hypothetical protein [Chelativorans sp. J32]|uniref:hypothetical protein n=1 Tax=Chelativorans sp. J32 TaxID=935840 RepID=UPI0004B9E666|nr:hypothetical protein [Chelativorans sp. J32]